jgi:hypothetical protein
LFIETRGNSRMIEKNMRDSSEKKGKKEKGYYTKE